MSDGERGRVSIDGLAGSVLHRGAQSTAQGVLAPQAVAPRTSHGLPAEIHCILHLHEDVVLACDTAPAQLLSSKMG